MAEVLNPRYNKLWSIISKAALKSNTTAPTIFLLCHFLNTHPSFVSVESMLNALLYKHAESLLLICYRDSIVSGQTAFFSRCLQSFGNRLLGRLFEPVKGALLFLGSSDFIFPPDLRANAL